MCISVYSPQYKSCHDVCIDHIRGESCSFMRNSETAENLPVQRYNGVVVFTTSDIQLGFIGHVLTYIDSFIQVNSPILCQDYFISSRISHLSIIYRPIQ